MADDLRADYEHIIRDAVHDAWRLGIGTATRLIELHHTAGTPTDQIIHHLRQLSAGDPHDG